MAFNLTFLNTTEYGLDAAGVERRGDVAVLADGDVVLSWLENVTGTYGVYVQRFSPGLEPRGDALLLDETTLFVDRAPQVVALADGGYVTYWHGSGIDGRRFAADDTDITGSLTRAFGEGSSYINDRGGVVIVSSLTLVTTDRLGTDLWGGAVDTSSFSVAALAGGGHAVAIGGTDPRVLIYGTEPGVVTATVLTGAEVLTDAADRADDLVQPEVALAGLADGGLILAWLQYDPSAGGTPGVALRVQAFEADGTARGAALTAATGPGSGFLRDVQIAAQTDGSAVVSWTQANDGDAANPSDIMARIIASDGTARSAAFQVNGLDFGANGGARLTAVPDGGFYAAWHQFSASFSDYEIWGRAFDADGMPRDATGNTGDQELRSTTALTYAFPEIAVGNDRLYATWTEQGLNTLFGTRALSAINDVQVSVFQLPLREDVITGTPGRDTLAGTPSDDVMLGDDGADLMYGNTGDDLMRGGAGADVVYGGPGGDTLEGGAGNDTLGGWDGDDSLLGGDGDDEIWTASGNDTARGGAGNDTLGGAFGNDSLEGGTGADELWGAVGDDTLQGGADNDTLGGASGSDSLSGGTGDDEVWGASGRDTLSGGDGNDRLGGGADNDILEGGTGDDEVFGGLGNDVVSGGSGNDQLFGAAGDDTLTGGAGNDTIYGGPGADMFVFGAGDGADQIGFFSATDDRLQLDDALWSGTLTTAQIVTQFGAVQGNDYVLDFGGGDTITLLDRAALTGLDGGIDIV